LDTTHRDRTAWQLKRERSLLANLGRGLDCSTWLYTHPITPPLSSHRHRCGTGELKLVIAYGGGYFPHNMGRLDRNVKNAPQSIKNITRKPSEYLKRSNSWIPTGSS
jgi:hypothetical protein